jgi:hypothetical protein
MNKNSKKMNKSKWSKKSEKIFSNIKKYGPSKSKSYKKEWTKRGYFTKHYAWAVPNKTAIKKIKKFAQKEQILEVGAGSGLWAYLLREAGANIIATDDYSWKIKRPYTKVEKINVQKSLDKYKDTDVLLLVWPPHDKPMANNALKKFKGNKLVYIGEGYGGATANDRFENRLGKYWKHVDQYNIPHWIGLHDTMIFYERV